MNDIDSAISPEHLHAAIKAGDQDGFRKHLVRVGHRIWPTGDRFGSEQGWEERTVRVLVEDRLGRPCTKSDLTHLGLYIGCHEELCDHTEAHDLAWKAAWSLSIWLHEVVQVTVFDYATRVTATAVNRKIQSGPEPRANALGWLAAAIEVGDTWAFDCAVRALGTCICRTSRERDIWAGCAATYCAPGGDILDVYVSSEDPAAQREVIAVMAEQLGGMLADHLTRVAVRILIRGPRPWQTATVVRVPH